MKTYISAALILFAPVAAFAGQKLKNGAPIFYVQNKDEPRSTVTFRLQGGASLLPQELQAVTTTLTASLGEGPEGTSPEEYRSKLFFMGASIDFSFEDRFLTFTVKAPPERLKEALKLVRETLANPKTDAETFKDRKENVTTRFQSYFSNMKSATEYFAKKDFLNYSQASMDGHTFPFTVSALSHKEFLENYKELLRPEKMFVTYSGPETDVAVRKKLENVFSAELKQKFIAPAAVEAPKTSVKGMDYVILNKPGATDNQIRVLFPQKFARNSEEYAVGQVTMRLLGGGPTGKLQNTLREIRGLTYDARASFSPFLGFWKASSFGGIKEVGPLLKGILEVIEKFQKEPATQKELDDARKELAYLEAASRENPAVVIAEKAFLYSQGLDPELSDRFEADLKKVTLEQVNTFKKSLNTKDGRVYVMGDKDILLKTLESNGVNPKNIRVVELADIK